MTADIDYLLNFNPIQEAQDMTGLDVLTDETTRSIAARLRIETLKAIKKVMDELQDTYEEMPWEEFKNRILGSLFNFKLIYKNNYSTEEEVLFADKNRGIFVFAFSSNNKNNLDYAHVSFQIKKRNYDTLRKPEELIKIKSRTKSFSISEKKENGILYCLHLIDLCFDWVVPWKKLKPFFYFWNQYDLQTHGDEDLDNVVLKKVGKIEKEYQNIIKKVLYGKRSIFSTDKPGSNERVEKDDNPL